MENMEEIFHFLEDFSKRKPKVIPQELNDYLAYVARTGDPVYQWSLVKSLFKEKLLNVITDFYESTPSIEIPPYPNVDPFNYEVMKNSLLERLDSFAAAPFTVQRICELLTYPRKQYNRIDKFMRAVEKNILVVSTREPGSQRHIEQENGEPAEPIVNGSDNNSDYNVDVEMEDMSWKENREQQSSTNAEPQPSSSDTHITVDDIEARLSAKQDTPMQSEEKATTEYESLTPPPELNISAEEETKPSEPATTDTTSPIKSPESETSTKMEETTQVNIQEEPLIDEETKPMETETTEKDPLIIPEIKVEDAEMTEQRLAEESTKEQPKEEKIEPEPAVIIETVNQEEEKIVPTPSKPEETKVEQMPEETPVEPPEETLQSNPAVDENSSDSTMKEEKEEPETKTIAEVLTSSEESSSSSDNTDGNSNSPKLEIQSDSLEFSSDTNQADSSSDAESNKPEPPPEPQPIGDTVTSEKPEETKPVSEHSEIAPQIQSENYSISDVKSELPQPVAEPPKEPEQQKLEEDVKEAIVEEPKKEEAQKTESAETETPAAETSSEN